MENAVKPNKVTTLKRLVIGDNQIYETAESLIRNGYKDSETIFFRYNGEYRIRRGMEEQAREFVANLPLTPSTTPTANLLLQDPQMMPITLETYISERICLKKRAKIYSAIKSAIESGNRALIKHTQKENGNYVIVPGHERPIYSWIRRNFEEHFKSHNEIPLINFTTYFPISNSYDSKIMELRWALEELERKNKVLKDNSRVMGRGRSYCDTPEVREIINREAKKLGIPVTPEEVAAEKERTAKKPAAVISSDAELELRKNPGAISIMPNSNIPIFALEKNYLPAKPQSKEFTPKGDYIVVKKEVLEDLLTPARANQRTHLSLVEITQERLHIPGPFAMQYKTELGNLEIGSSGIMGYRKEKVARVLERWLGKEGEKFRKEHPYQPVKIIKSAAKKEKKEPWYTLAEIVTEFGIPFDIAREYQSSFGKTCEIDVLGKKKRTFAKSAVTRALDKLVDKGVIELPESVDEENTEEDEADDGEDGENEDD